MEASQHEQPHWFGEDFTEMPEMLRSLWHPRDSRRIRKQDLLLVANHTDETNVYFTLPGEKFERSLPWRAPDLIAHKVARNPEVNRSVWVMIHPGTPFDKDHDRPSPLKLLRQRPHPTPMQDLTAPSRLGDPRALRHSTAVV